MRLGKCLQVNERFEISRVLQCSAGPSIPIDPAAISEMFYPIVFLESYRPVFATVGETAKLLRSGRLPMP